MKNNSEYANYKGYKLSNCADNDNISVVSPEGAYVVIGGVGDDTGASYRVMIDVLFEPEILSLDDPPEGFCTSVDLEDVLSFCAKHCRPLMEKTLRENEAKS